LPASEVLERIGSHFSAQLSAQSGVAAIWGRCAVWATSSEHAARLAGVLTLFADPDAAEISGEAIGSAIVLAPQHYATEAVRLADAAQISADALIADKVRLWLMHNWSEPLASLPDIYQHGPNVVREKAKAEKVVRMLEEHGHLHRIAGGATIRGTKRRDVWRIVGKAAA
jgi:hypothetical protein